MQYLVPQQLETKRLRLRQFKQADWQDLHQYYSNTQATKFTVGRAFTEGDTWRTMCSMLGHWHIRGYGPYAVEEKISGTVIGTVGFWYPNDWPSPEIKWALAAKFWGQGYASEAAKMIQKTGKKCLPNIDLISLIHSDNAASIKLAKAVGAKFEKHYKFRGGEWVIYRHP